MKRETLLEILQADTPTVTFTKQNGDERVMRCTLREDLVPATKGNLGRPENLNVIRVFDLDLNSWRSFKVASVKAVTSSVGLGV